MEQPTPLSGLVDIWWTAIHDLTTLLDKLGEEDWHRPTDLAGWDVHDVAAHVAHLEAVAAGGEHDDIDVGEPAHVKSPMGTFTEQGVVARRDVSPDDLVNELRSSATRRHTALLAEPPTDPSAPAPGVFGAIGWDTELFLRNRPVDVWMHEQDIRRATGSPGNLDGEVAAHVIATLGASFPRVVGKRVAPPAGTAVVLDVAGHEPLAAVIGDDGRGAVPEESPATATARIGMDAETYVLAAGGRRPAETLRYTVEGDDALARDVVAALAVTP